LRAASDDNVYKEKNEDHVFPFDSLKGTPSKMFLYRMYEEATRFLDSGYCLEGKGACIDCGACEDKKLTIIPEISQKDIERLRITIEMKKRPQTARVVVIIKEPGRFLTPEAKCAFMGRAILQEIPELVKSYLSCRQVQNMEPAKGYGSLFGRFQYDIEFSGTAQVFSEFISKNVIDTPLLAISPMDEGINEDIFRFRVNSSWNDPDAYSFQNTLQDYLLGNDMGFDIRKSGGIIFFEVAMKDKKKKIIYSAKLQQEIGNVLLELETGPKFRIVTLVKHLFKGEWMKAKVESF
jgi:hypothetical protein